MHFADRFGTKRWRGDAQMGESVLGDYKLG
jgi:hypothetical protein